jgi:hypothetical protein
MKARSIGFSFMGNKCYDLISVAALNRLRFIWPPCSASIQRTRSRGDCNELVICFVLFRRLVFGFVLRLLSLYFLLNSRLLFLRIPLMRLLVGISSSIVDSVSAITTVIAIWGAVLSTYLVVLKIKEDKVDLRVTIRKIEGDPHFGKKGVNIGSVRLKLRCGGKEYSFRSLKTFKDGLVGDILIPYQFNPDRKLETSVDYYEIYKFVFDKYEREKDGDPYGENFDLDPKYLSRCQLIAYFEDQLGNIYQSEPTDI